MFVDFANPEASSICDSQFNLSNVAEHVYTQLKPINSAFLRCLNLLDSALLIDEGWANKYDETVIGYTTFESMLDLVISAPNEFSKGVVFGKLNAIQAISMVTGRPILMQNRRSDDTKVELSVSTQEYMVSIQKMEGHGAWSHDYDEVIDFYAQSISGREFGDLMNNLNTLLDSAPTDFCQGVLYGKMAVLMDIQGAMA